MTREGMELKQNLEERLKRMEGVLVASVKLTKDNSLEAVNLIVDNSRSYSSWKEELLEILRQTVKEDVDPAILNLVTWDSRELQQRWGRPRLEKVSFQADQNQAQIKVCLSWRGDYLWGEASGPNTPTFLRMLIAQATIKALEGFLKDSFSLSVLSSQEISSQDRTLIVVCVGLTSPYGEQSFSGSAFVRNNYLEAVVKATLDSLNRIWERISI